MSFCGSFTTLSVACLVRDKCHCRKENKEDSELKVDCLVTNYPARFFLSVVDVLGEDCRLFSESRPSSLLPHRRPH